MLGGMVEGVHMDTVSNPLAGIEGRCAPMDDERALDAMVEFLAVHRHRRETADKFLSLYDVIRRRA